MSEPTHTCTTSACPIVLLCCPCAGDADNAQLPQYKPDRKTVNNDDIKAVLVEGFSFKTPEGMCMCGRLNLQLIPMGILHETQNNNVHPPTARACNLSVLSRFVSLPCPQVYIHHHQQDWKDDDDNDVVGSTGISSRSLRLSVSQ